MNIYPSKAKITKAVQDARWFALLESQSACGKGGVHRSRGVEFSVVDDRGDKLNESGCWSWGGGKAEYDRDIAAILAKWPEAVAIHLEGGYDFSESIYAFAQGEYDPWVSEWSVLVWQKSVDSPDGCQP